MINKSHIGRHCGMFLWNLSFRFDHCCLQAEEESFREYFQGENILYLNYSIRIFCSYAEAKDVAVQDDLVELYSGNNNDAKMKTKNVVNSNQAANGIVVSSV